MIRVTRQTDYGIVLLTHIGRAAAGQIHTSRALAAETRLPVPMVSKILKHLTRAGVLVSQRGANGGYSLSRPATEISVAEVIAALEGPIAITDCAGEEPGSCEHEDNCRVSGNWQQINLAIRTALEALSLADMAVSEPAELVTLKSYGETHEMETETP